jgi:hypothetical protein
MIFWVLLLAPEVAFAVWLPVACWIWPVVFALCALAVPDRWLQ